MFHPLCSRLRFPASPTPAGSACSLALCFPLNSVDLIQLYLIKSFPLIINLGLLSEQVYFISPSAASHLSKISLEIRGERMLMTNTKVAREASCLPTLLSASIKAAVVVRGANRPLPWLWSSSFANKRNYMAITEMQIAVRYQLIRCK